MGVAVGLGEFVRPVAVVPVFVIALLVGLMGSDGYAGPVSLAQIALAATILTTATVVGDTLNQVSDIAEDSVHPTKQDRPVPRGSVSPFRVTAYGVLTWLLLIAIAVLLLPELFTLALVLILVFVWLYTFMRGKERLGWNQLALSTPRGAIGFAAAWVVHGSLLSPVLWSLLAVSVPYVILANESRNIGPDREADLAVGVQNITTVYGEGTARIVVLAGLLWPLVPVVALSLWAWSPWFWVLAVPGAIGVVGFRRLSPGALWRTFYLGLALIPVAFALGMFAH